MSKLLTPENRPDYEAWINFFHTQGWNYKILRSGHIQVKVTNYSKVVSIHISKSELRLFFYSYTGPKQPVSGSVFYVLVKNNKIITTSDNKYYKFKSVRNEDSLSIRLNNLIRTQPPVFRKADSKGIKVLNQVSMQSTKVNRKLSLILKLFMGLNEIKWQYDYFKKSFGDLTYAHNYSDSLFSRQKYFNLSPQARKYARKNQIGKLAKYIYGYNSKIIRKHIIQEQIHPLNNIDKTLWNRGEIELFLESGNIIKIGTAGQHEQYQPRLKAFLDEYGKERLKNIILSPGSGAYLFFDLLDMHYKLKSKEGYIKAPRANSIEEMHEYYVILQNKLRYGNVKFDTRYETLKSVDGAEIEIEGKIHKILVPKDSNMLLEWGQKLNNCIFSYTQRFMNGNTNLFAVEVDGKVKSTLEISTRMELIQFKDNFNKNTVDNEVKPIYSFIKQTLLEQKKEL